MKHKMQNRILLVILSLFLRAGLSAAGIISDELKGEWSLKGVSSTVTAKAEPWQYSPMSWEFIDRKKMVYKIGNNRSIFTYELEGNDVEMTIMNITTTYTVEKINNNSMIWHNPTMNNYYHLEKIK